MDVYFDHKFIWCGLCIYSQRLLHFKFTERLLCGMLFCSDFKLTQAVVLDLHEHHIGLFYVEVRSVEISYSFDVLNVSICICGTESSLQIVGLRS